MQNVVLLHINISENSVSSVASQPYDRSGQHINDLSVQDVTSEGNHSNKQSPFFPSKIS